MLQRYFWPKLLILVIVALVLGACGTPTTGTSAEGTAHSDGEDGHAHSHSEGSEATGSHSHGEEFELPHIHGLGFSADGKQLLIPAHVGVFTVSEGKWSRADGPEHDYMGFAMSNDGFYSSGHPAPSATDLSNPLGLVKSTDNGKTLQTLGFAGESDFHLMAVGYQNHAIYVLNPAQNSKLEPGLHYSLDDGQTWKQSALKGIRTVPLAIAVHPNDGAIVALATEGGVMLSNDHGEVFTLVSQPEPVAAVSFSSNGDLLFGASEVFKYKPSSKQIETLVAPPLVEGEFISYIAVNPVNPRMVAVATSERNVFQSDDNGQQWDTLASNGLGVNTQK